MVRFTSIGTALVVSLLFVGAIPQAEEASDSLDLLRSQVASLQRRVAELAEERAVDEGTDIRVVLSTEALTSLVDRFNNLPEASRTANFRSTRTSGYIWETSGDCKVLGRKYAEFSKFIEIDDEVRAKLSASDLGLSIQENGMWLLAANLGFSTNNFRLHWHLDECIGGGVGGKVRGRLQASSRASAQVRFATEGNALRYEVQLVAPDRVKARARLDFGDLGSRTMELSVPVVRSNVAEGQLKFLEPRSELRFSEPRKLVKPFVFRVNQLAVESAPNSVAISASGDVGWLGVPTAVEPADGE